MTQATTEPEAVGAPDPGQTAVEVQEVQFPEAHDQPGKPAPGQIDLLLDITVKVQACLGEVEILVRDLLQLNVGSVVTLDRKVGEPADLYLKGQRFATGHLVVVGDRLGVRIKEILPAEIVNPSKGGN